MSNPAPEGQEAQILATAAVAEAPAAAAAIPSGGSQGSASAPTTQSATAARGQVSEQQFSEEDLNKYYEALMNGAPVATSAPPAAAQPETATPVPPADPAPEPEAPAEPAAPVEPEAPAEPEEGRLKSRKVRPASPEWDALIAMMGRNPDLTPEEALAKLRGTEPAPEAEGSPPAQAEPDSPQVVLADIARISAALKAARAEDDIIRVTELTADLAVAQASLELAKATSAENDRFMAEFRQSQAEAVKVYPDLAIENSAFRQKAVELDQLFANSTNPLHRAIYDSPDRPALIAQQAAFALEKEGKAVRRAPQTPQNTPVPTPAPKPAAAAPIMSGTARTSAAPSSSQDAWMQEFSNASAVKQEQMLRARGLLA